MKYILAVLVMVFSMQSSADSWLCIADKATGFILENGSWGSSDFKGGDAYMIEEADDFIKNPGEIYSVYSFKFDSHSYRCGDFESSNGMLICDGIVPGGTFKYNPSTGHFLMTNTFGYVHGNRGGFSDPPVMMIGKCSKR